MDQRKLLADEEKIPPVRVQREGSSAVCFIRTLFDPETTGCANAVLGTMVIPPGQPELMVPHAHMEYDESEYVVSGGGFVLIRPVPR